MIINNIIRNNLIFIFHCFVDIFRHMCHVILESKKIGKNILWKCRSKTSTNSSESISIHYGWSFNRFFEQKLINSSVKYVFIFWHPWEFWQISVKEDWKTINNNFFVQLKQRAQLKLYSPWGNYPLVSQSLILYASVAKWLH